MQGALRRILPIAGLAVAYFLAARLGLSLTFVNASASPVWPPTGIAIGALLLGGWRLWPGVWIGALAANFVVGQHLPSSAFIATGNTLEALTAIWFLHRYKPFLRTPSNVVRFVALGAFAAAAVSALIGAATLLAYGFADLPGAGPILFTWWLGDALGALLIVPLIIFWGSPEEKMTRTLEAATILAFALAITAVVFGPWVGGAKTPNLLLLLLLPALLAAFRLSPRWSATSGTAMAGLAILGTLYGYGPFASNDLNWGLLQLQAYIAFLTVVGLGLSAVVTSNRLTNSMLYESKLQLSGQVAETQLNLSRLAAVIRSEEVAILSTDLQGKVTSWNPGATALYGYQAHEMQGQSVMRLVREEEQPGAKDVIQKVLEGQLYKFHNAVRLHKNGKEVQVWVSLAPVRDGHGRVVGVSSLSRSTKESLEAAQAKHEQQVAEQKVRALQEITDFKTQFLNMASHELRTPLTPLKLQLRMLGLRLEGNNEVAPSLDSLERNVERLASLVDDLFYAAQAQSGRLRFEPQPTALDELLEASIYEMRDVMRERDVHLAANLEEVTASVDPNRMSQVVHNLLNNAIKYGEPGGHIQLTLESNDSHVKICVQDDGIGMDPDEMHRLFQPFSRLHEGERPGTGLGLYICVGIIEMHGGTLVAHSEGLGQGSEFTVTLPHSSESSSSSTSNSSGAMSSGPGWKPMGISGSSGPASKS